LGGGTYYFVKKWKEEYKKATKKQIGTAVKGTIFEKSSPINREGGKDSPESIRGDLTIQLGGKTKTRKKRFCYLAGDRLCLQKKKGVTDGETFITFPVGTIARKIEGNEYMCVNTKHMRPQ